jgi:hypothetical protein
MLLPVPWKATNRCVSMRDYERESTPLHLLLLEKPGIVREEAPHFSASGPRKGYRTLRDLASIMYDAEPVPQKSP